MVGIMKLSAASIELRPQDGIVKHTPPPHAFVPQYMRQNTKVTNKGIENVDPWLVVIVTFVLEYGQVVSAGVTRDKMRLGGVTEGTERLEKQESGQGNNKTSRLQFPEHIDIYLTYSTTKILTSTFGCSRTP